MKLLDYLIVGILGFWFVFVFVRKRKNGSKCAGCSGCCDQCDDGIKQ